MSLLCCGGGEGAGAGGCHVTHSPSLVSQGTSGPDPTTVYVDMRALRHDRSVRLSIITHSAFKKFSLLASVALHFEKYMSPGN